MIVKCLIMIRTEVSDTSVSVEFILFNIKAKGPKATYIAMYRTNTTVHGC